jgi:hypothetical protein
MNVGAYEYPLADTVCAASGSAITFARPTTGSKLLGEVKLEKFI